MTTTKQSLDRVQKTASDPEIVPHTERIAHGHWVEPEFLAEIEYRAKSAGGKTRHSLFKGLRDDLQ